MKLQEGADSKRLDVALAVARADRNRSLSGGEALQRAITSRRSLLILLKSYMGTSEGGLNLPPLNEQLP